jgi:glycosyltransferase involved in cell wall biosynthesis
VVYSFLATIRALFGGYDVVHYHAEGPCGMMWLPKLFRIPVVSTIHGLDWQRSKWGGFATRYLLYGERCAAKYSDEMIVLSQEMQRYFEEVYGRRTDYVCNGVSIPEIMPADIIKKEYGLEKDNYILYLGRLVPEKGIHYLLEAFRATRTDKKLVIAGRIDRRNDYVNQICDMASLDDRVIMTDFVHGQKLEELFSNCFLYVLPSDVEGMAISLLEAMSYGAHCLLSNIHENIEAAEEYAEYFEKGDVKELQMKLQEILDRKEPFDKTKQIKFVEERYSWDKIVDSTVELYELARMKEGRYGRIKDDENINGKQVPLSQGGRGDVFLKNRRRTS